MPASVKQPGTVFKHPVCPHVVQRCKKDKCKDEKGSRDSSKADQGGVEPPQKAVKAWMALQEATHIQWATGPVPNEVSVPDPAARPVRLLTLRVRLQAGACRLPVLWKQLINSR